MKVFLSWSGAGSRALAEQLREWLPSVLQAVEPWMSSEDIDKGARWSTDIAKELEQAKVGLICVTRDNQHEPWIHFEAGALSKTLEKTFVIPYLLRMKPADLKGPLVQFQAAVADAQDTLRVVRAINRALGDEALPDSSVDRYFKKWWPELEAAIKAIPTVQSAARPERPDRDILEEILDLIRQLVREPSAAELMLPDLHRFVGRKGEGHILDQQVVYTTKGPVRRTYIRFPDRDEVIETPLAAVGDVSPSIRREAASVAEDDENLERTP